MTKQRQVCKDTPESILDTALTSEQDQEMDSLKAVVAEIKALPRIEPSRDLAPEIIAKIKANSDCVAENRLVLRPAFGWGIAAAVLLLICGLSIRFYAGRESVKADASTSLINRSTEWLLNAQEPDGSWDPAKWGGRGEYKVALTGLAMMALARIESSAEISNERILKAVSRAADYVAGQQSEDGLLGPRIDGCLYNHGIAAAALVNSSQNISEQAKQAMTKAISYIKAVQSHEGAWGYAEGPDNTSITVWQLRALVDAKSIGINGIDQSIARATRWLSARIDDRGRLGYQASGDSGSKSPTLTAMGASIVMDARTGTGIETLREKIRSALQSLPSEIATPDLYRDFFMVEALEKSGDSVSRAAAGKVRSTIIERYASQHTEDGSVAPDSAWGRVGGKIYSTSFASMSVAPARSGS